MWLAKALLFCFRTGKVFNKELVDSQSLDISNRQATTLVDIGWMMDPADNPAFAIANTTLQNSASTIRDEVGQKECGNIPIHRVSRRI